MLILASVIGVDASIQGLLVAKLDGDAVGVTYHIPDLYWKV